MDWEKKVLRLFNNELVKLKLGLKKIQVELQGLIPNYLATQKYYKALKQKNKRLGIKINTCALDKKLELAKNKFFDQSKNLYDLALKIQELKVQKLMLQFNEECINQRIKYINDACTSLVEKKESVVITSFQNYEDVLQYLQQCDLKFPLIAMEKYK